MYLDYFGLKQKPFLITPDPAFLYPSAGHQQALAHLQYGLQREGGFLLLTGEVGTGKTTLCRLFMENLPESFRLAYLLNTKLESGGLLAGICRELGIACGDERDVNKLVERIYDNLLEAHAGGRQTLVVIEEAQNLSPDVLETLRLLTNLETSATKLLHILLIGQPELLETLGQPGLRQLNQRVVSRSHLGALARADLAPYVRHRLKMAGTERPLFTAAALKLLYDRTGGIPRLVNLLAEHALMGAYATGTPQVTAAIVRRAAREIFPSLRQPRRTRSRWPLGAAAALVLLAGGAASYYGLISWKGEGTPAPALAPPALADRPDDKQGADVPSAGEVLETSAKAAAAPEELVAAAATEPPGAYDRLLAHWNIPQQVASERELCETAQLNGLRCVRQPATSAAALAAIGRPMVVRLFDGTDRIGIYYLENLSGETLTLANNSGEREGAAVDLLPAMEPEVLFLWQPPVGYLEPLAPGETNPALVNQLQRWLTASGHLRETLVTGGVYGDYLASRVRAFQAAHGLAVDGILGEQTLLHLSRYDTDPGRVTGAGD